MPFGTDESPLSRVDQVCFARHCQETEWQQRVLIVIYIWRHRGKERLMCMYLWCILASRIIFATTWPDGSASFGFALGLECSVIYWQHSWVPPSVSTQSDLPFNIAFSDGRWPNNCSSVVPSICGNGNMVSLMLPQAYSPSSQTRFLRHWDGSHGLVLSWLCGPTTLSGLSCPPAVVSSAS